MKLLKNILFYLFSILIIISCSKEEDLVEEDISVVNIYENSPNTVDDLIADTYDANSKSYVYYYGSFNNNGIPEKLKSLVLNKKNSDTLHHYVLDEFKRIKIAYSSLKNGNKLSNIVKFNYQNNSTCKISIHNYDWLNNTDLLLKEFECNYITNTSILTYGRTMSQSESDDFEQNELNPFKNGMITNKHIFGAAVFVSAGVCFVAPPICPTAAGFIIGSAILFSGQITKASELKTIKNPLAPISPSTQTLPNPTGTPTYPGGYLQLIKGQWKANSVTLCGIELFSTPYVQNVVTSCGTFFNKYPICRRDNILQINDNLTYTVNEGIINCGSNYEESGQCYLNGESITFANSLAPTNGTITKTIILLNNNFIKLKLSYPNGLDEITTYARQ